MYYSIENTHWGLLFNFSCLTIVSWLEGTISRSSPWLSCSSALGNHQSFLLHPSTTTPIPLCPPNCRLIWRVFPCCQWTISCSWGICALPCRLCTSACKRSKTSESMAAPSTGYSQGKCSTHSNSIFPHSIAESHVMELVLREVNSLE